MNLELVEQIVALMGEYPVSEIEVASGGRRIAVRRPAVPALPAVVAAPSPALPGEAPALEEAVPAEETWTLTAPMVGIFRHALPSLPAPVRAGQVVGSIESMKLMNDVVTEREGHVADVLVEDGAPVEYGQSLLRLFAV